MKINRSTNLISKNTLKKQKVGKITVYQFFK